MKALSQAIIDVLQASLSAHWQAVEQYSAQAAHFARWGYSKLAARSEADAKEETEHAKRLLDRLQSLDTAPGFTHAAPNYPERDLVGILAANLSLENHAAELERKGILIARQSGDEVTAQIFAENLECSEESIREIEAIQGQINDMTLGQYLSTQL